MELHNLLPTMAILIAAVRAIVVFNGLLFMFLRSKRTIEWNHAMKIAFAEPFLLAAAAASTWLSGSLAPMAGPPIAILLLGAMCSSGGLVLFLWSFVAYPSVGTGHYVDEDHEVVRAGPYALVRHPMYCAAVFVWLGLALATADWALLTLTFAYVVPAYYFYALEEERMMSRELGSVYVRYASQVPMLFPRPLNVWE